MNRVEIYKKTQKTPAWNDTMIDLAHFPPFPKILIFYYNII